MPPETRNRTGLVRHQASAPQPPSGIRKGSRRLGVTSALLERYTMQPNSNTHQITCDDLESDDSEQTQVEPTLDAVEPATRKNKRGRGPTMMPKTWCVQDEKRVAVSVNDLGQPIKENTSTLAHFLGTIARNGKLCPLQYKDWRIMPQTYKQRMLELVKRRFDLSAQQDTFVLRSINKKWKSWKSSVKKETFHPNKSIEEQLAKLPERVLEDQYKVLVEHWLEDKTEARSEKNKLARGEVDYIHRLGKKSLATVKQTMFEELGRYPTRAEMFKEVYYKPDGTTESDEILALVEQMEEEAAKNPKDLTANTAFFDLDDAFSAVMGKDKNGQVRMYGTGITSADVCGKKPSRATLIKENSEYKEKYQHATEENITLRKEFEEFKAIVNSKLQGIGQPEIERAQVESPNVQHSSQSLPLTASNTQRSSKSASRQPVIRVGSNVVLKNFGDNEVVANGVISEMDNVRVNGMDLGPQFCSVIIQVIMKKEERLFFPYGHCQTIGDTLGAPVAWPSYLAYSFPSSMLFNCVIYLLVGMRKRES